jgi:hypothetical protein
MIKGVWESVKLGPLIHMKGWRLVGGINRWCMICYYQKDNLWVVCGLHGDEVEDRLVVPHDETNGR